MSEKIPAPMYATVEEVTALIAKAESPEELSKVMSLTSIQAPRAQGRGLRERIPAQVKLSTSLKHRALKHFHDTVGNYIQGPMKEALSKELAKLGNMPSHTRSSARPRNFTDPAPDLQITWRNTNPKQREKGRWIPFLMVPLNLYADSLGLKGPTQIGDRFVTTDAIEVNYKAKEIKLNMSKATKTRIVETSDQIEEEEDSSDHAMDDDSIQE